MRRSLSGLSAIALLSVLSATAPALAQDEAVEPIKFTGNVALVSDYRFRGFSQSAEDPAIQGGITATHESGFYVGTWASSINLSGYGDAEIDLFGGFSKQIAPGLTADIGMLFYLYPQHNKPFAQNFFEPYANLIGTVGPATIKVGVNYAWAQDALIGIQPNADLGSKVSALYVHAEPSIAIPNTPLGINGHLGYAKSDSFLGGPEGDVIDYSVGATATYKMLTLGVSYVNTDVKKVLGKELIGADGAVVFSLTAAF